MSLQKNASIQNCSIVVAKRDKSLPAVASRAAAHVPLPRITMSKSNARTIKGELTFCQRRNAAHKNKTRERRGRGLYEGVPPKSNPNNQLFSGVVDGLEPA